MWTCKCSIEGTVNEISLWDKDPRPFVRGNDEYAKDHYIPLTYEQAWKLTCKRHKGIELLKLKDPYAESDDARWEIAYQRMTRD